VQALCIRTTPAKVLRSAMPRASYPNGSAVSVNSIASDAPRRKENGELMPSSTYGDGVVVGGGMSSVRTNFKRENPGLSGISQRARG
jgi:hypothetical protein